MQSYDVIVVRRGNAAVQEFNAAMHTDIRFDPSTKNGRCTVGIESPKSDWAYALDTPPYAAYVVTCGITFTIGGLRIDPESDQVLDLNFHRIPSLYTAGEMVGGVFDVDDPAGTGLVSGTAFGRIAGCGAASAVIAAATHVI